MLTSLPLDIQTTVINQQLQKKYIHPNGFDKIKIQYSLLSHTPEDFEHEFVKHLPSKLQIFFWLKKKIQVKNNQISHELLH